MDNMPVEIEKKGRSSDNRYIYYCFDFCLFVVIMLSCFLVLFYFFCFFIFFSLALLALNKGVSIPVKGGSRTGICKGCTRE